MKKDGSDFLPLDGRSLRPGLADSWAQTRLFFFFLRLDLLLLLHRRLWLCRLRWKHLLFIELPLGHLETSGPMARHVV